MKQSYAMEVLPKNNFFKPFSIYNNELHGNDDLPKEFCETLWGSLEEPLLNSICTSFF